MEKVIDLLDKNLDKADALPFPTGCLGLCKMGPLVAILPNPVCEAVEVRGFQPA